MARSDSEIRSENGEARAVREAGRAFDAGPFLMHLRPTLNIDRVLPQRAAKLTGISEETPLVRMGLEALVAAASARRLAELGGSEP